MAFVVLRGGNGAAVTLCLTSQPVTFPGPDVPVEVPDGYLPVLLDPVMVAPHCVRLYEPVADEPEEDEAAPPETPPVAPKKASRKPKEA